MLWVVQEGGHNHGGTEHQALVDSFDLALPQRRDFGLPLSDGRREGGAIVGLPPGLRPERLKRRALFQLFWQLLVLDSWLQVTVGKPTRPQEVEASMDGRSPRLKPSG